MEGRRPHGRAWIGTAAEGAADPSPRATGPRVLERRLPHAWDGLAAWPSGREPDAAAGPNGIAMAAGHAFQLFGEVD